MKLKLKMLGVVFDENLNFEEHMMKLVKKTRQAQGVIYRVSRKIPKELGRLILNAEFSIVSDNTPPKSSTTTNSGNIWTANFKIEHDCCDIRKASKFIQHYIDLNSLD